MVKISQLVTVAGIIFLAGCHPKTKENKDEIYSRHLQKHISLTIVSTPVPKNKSDFNLLVLNNGQGMKQANIAQIVDSLYRKKFLNPLIIVGVHAFDPAQEYGVSGFADGKNKGSLAGKYADFVINELLPFVKKKAGVRSFNSVCIAGPGMAGISAIDIAWDNWQKFDKVGYLPDFSNSKSNTDFSLLVEKISKSKKRPKLQIWLDAMADTTNAEKSDSTSMERLFDVLNTKGMNQGVSRINIESNKNDVVPFKDSFSKFLMWLNEVY